MLHPQRLVGGIRNAAANAGASRWSLQMIRKHLLSRPFHKPGLSLAALALSLMPVFSGAAAPRSAPPDYESWPLLAPEFPSTGGGGVMIRGYEPDVTAGRCITDFQAVLPDGTIYRNEVSFDAIPTSGGILCTNGKWRARDGSAEGTTPFEIFIRDGVRRMKP
jgi:hypothetical protein